MLDAAQQRSQVLSVHELHGQERHTVRFADVVDAAHVRVRDLSREAHLGAEPLLHVRVTLERPADELDRHLLAETRVLGAEHLAHATALDHALDDAVAPRQQASRQELSRPGGDRRGRWFSDRGLGCPPTPRGGLRRSRKCCAARRAEGILLVHGANAYRTLCHAALWTRQRRASRAGEHAARRVGERLLQILASWAAADRVLVIHGYGHLGWLRTQFADDPSLRLRRLAELVR